MIPSYERLFGITGTAIRERRIDLFASESIKIRSF